MNFTYENLAAVYRLCCYLARADGDVTPDETAPFRDFIYRFDGIGDEEVGNIVNMAVSQIGDDEVTGGLLRV